MSQHQRPEQQFRQYALRDAVPTVPTEAIPGESNSASITPPHKGIKLLRDISLLPENHTLVVNIFSKGVTLVKGTVGNFSPTVPLTTSS